MFIDFYLNTPIGKQEHAYTVVSNFYPIFIYRKYKFLPGRIIVLFPVKIIKSFFCHLKQHVDGKQHTVHLVCPMKSETQSTTDSKGKVRVC